MGVRATIRAESSGVRLTEFAQLVVKGMALGGVYALVALGFVVVFKATGVINFAHGSLLLTGAYLTYTTSVLWGLPFALAVMAAAAGAVALALAVERLVVRPLVGQPAVAVVLATLGVAIVVDQLVTVVWGFRPHHIGDPWGAGSVRLGGLVVSHVDIASLVIVAAMVAALSLFFLRTDLGLALRAAAADSEAAAAQGIRPALVSRTAWALAALVATAAGVLLASGPGAATPNLGEMALRAFPAVLLGGFVSFGGALAGGALIGVVEVLTAGYAPGQELVVPYLVMLGVLLVRPDGVFGVREARRL
ncbi:MAG: branched-chain amino acid ABC transporter permease [Acidimicrobiales bacterium]